jgi:hypothetical protein
MLLFAVVCVFPCILKKLISRLTSEYLSGLSLSVLFIDKLACMDISVHLHHVDEVHSILNVNHTLLRHEKSDTTLPYKCEL